MPLSRAIIFCLVVLISVAVPATAQDAEADLPDSADLKEAVTTAENDSELTDEQRTALLETLQRVHNSLKKRADYQQKKANFAAARESAPAEASSMQAALAKDSAAYDGKPPPPPDDLSLANVEQAAQAARAELTALEGSLSRLQENLNNESGKATRVREQISANQKLIEDLMAQAVSKEGARASVIQAQQWLQDTQLAALRAENAMLEEELLSQPMRLDLMRVKLERGNFDAERLRDQIKMYDQRALQLRQTEAQQVLSEVASTQESVADAHPAIQALAKANTLLTAEVTARTAALESVKSSEAQLSEEAVRYEADLESIKRKLEVLGMSEALGRVLREQQLRLPKRLRTRADLTRRDEEISDASLRQLAYEDERRKLRSISEYVTSLTAELPEDEAEAVRESMKELAQTRRDLIGRAIDIESTYVRALSDLDFATRRLQSASSAYREFISERLLWIRSAPVISLDALRTVPAEFLNLVNPLNWSSAVLALPAALLDTPIYSLVFLLVVGLLFFRGRLREFLESTSANVGHVELDSFSTTLTAVLLTFIMAAPLPALLYTIGFSLDAYGVEGPVAKAIAFSLERISIYLYGFEVLRCMFIPDGLMRGHCLWPETITNRIARKIWQLEVLFLPLVLLAMLAGRSQPQEGQSTLASLALALAMLSLCRYFAQVPSVAQTQFQQLFAMRSARRRALLGRLFRYFMMALPLTLVACTLSGFVHTAAQFLVLLIWTIGLIAGLMVLHELGVRWLRIIRLRVIDAERKAAVLAARERADTDAPDKPVADFDEPDPKALDSEGRYLLNTGLTLAAIFGIWAVWKDVLPALGILDSFALWTNTQVVDGVDTSVPVTPLDIIQVLLVAFVGYVVIQRLPALLELLLRQKMELAAGTVYAGVTLVRYALIMAFVVVVLGLLGANWGQIQWAVAALSVGIGFGLQEIVANFISGLILLFEQPIRVGDTITVGETSGVVTKIRMRATTVRDWDGKELLVPNKEFITGRLLNWSLSDTQTRIVIEIGVAYGSDIPLAMKLALDAAKEHEEVLAEPAPFITFDAFGDNSLLLRLRAYLSSIDKRLTVSSQLREMINEKYNDAGIVIAFPQRDVHLNTLSPLEVHVKGMDGATAT